MSPVWLEPPNISVIVPPTTFTLVLSPPAWFPPPYTELIIPLLIFTLEVVVEPPSLLPPYTELIFPFPVSIVILEIFTLPDWSLPPNTKLQEELFETSTFVVGTPAFFPPPITLFNLEPLINTLEVVESAWFPPPYTFPFELSKELTETFVVAVEPAILLPPYIYEKLPLVA